MVEEDRWDVGLRQKILPHFYQRTERRTAQHYERNLQQATGSDFWPTVKKLVEIYVPGERISGIDNVYFQREVEADPFNRWMLLRNNFRVDLPEEAKLVAYTPDSQLWEKDLRVTTLGKYDQLRSCPYLGVPFNPLTDSGTKTLYVLTKFFRSGGEFGRDEAIDYLVLGMMEAYWVSLSRRLG